MKKPAAPGSLPSGFRWPLILSILGGLILVLLAGACFVLFSLLQEINPPDQVGVPSSLEATAAVDKFKLLEASEKQKGKGFVRFNASEINSLLHWLFFEEKSKAKSAFVNPPEVFRSWNIASAPSIPAKTNATRCTLLAVRVIFDPADNTFTWHSWMRKELPGLVRTVQWERKATLIKSSEGWGFDLKKMRVGKWEIPQKYWAMAQKHLGEADTSLEAVYRWFQKLPAVEFNPNETTHLPELKIYNYPEPRALGKGNP